MPSLKILPDTAALDLPDWQAKLTNANAERVKEVLRQAGQILAAIENAGTNSRMALGRVLLAVKERKLHLEWGFEGWMGFMEASQKLFFVSQRTAYEAMEMAASDALGAMEPAELAALPLSNARTLVKAEKVAAAAGKPLEPEVIQQAVELRPRDFRREVSAEEGAAIRVWVRDKAAAEHVERILRVLANASPEAAESFADFLESAELVAYAGESADNRIDAILGYLATKVPEGIRHDGNQGLRDWVNGIGYAAYLAQE